MINLELPKTIELHGENFAIRFDFCVILEIIIMLNDPSLDNDDKAEALIEMFFVEPERITDPKEAIDACFRFIDCNSDRKANPGKKLVDWEQDFNYIISPVTRVIGHDPRSDDYDPINNTGGFHWWSFVGAYMEISSDCLFSQIVSIRDKQARGKKLEKHEREWLRRNGDLVKIRTKYSDAENDLIDAWTKGVKPNG